MKKYNHIIIHHVTAIGSNYRFMSFYFDTGKLYTVRISDELYNLMRDNGIKTGQFVRFHKHG